MSQLQLTDEQIQHARFIRTAAGGWAVECRDEYGGLVYLPTRDPASLGWRMYAVSPTEFQAVRGADSGSSSAARPGVPAVEGAPNRKYFEGLPKGEMGARHKMKSIKLLEQQLGQLVIDRASPPAGANVVSVKDNEYMRLHEQYRAAEKAGEGRESDFQPLSTYAHKLTTKSGAVVRPLFQGEVGVFADGRVAVLEEGVSRENWAQVGADLAPRSDGAAVADSGAQPAGSAPAVTVRPEGGDPS